MFGSQCTINTPKIAKTLKLGLLLLSYRKKKPSSINDVEFILTIEYA